MRKNIYTIFIKRILDIACSILALLLFWWLFLIIALLVRLNLGKPVLYKATRIGRKEHPFSLYKFRSMIDAFDESGNPLPDSVRLTKFGRVLRSTSLDEIPELFCILKGDMSLIGPRPMPVSYLPYFKEEERLRHTVRPGLTGWAQINGRNAISWDKKFSLDVEYVKKMSFLIDVKILFMTVLKVFKREGIGQGEEAPTNLHEERVYMSNSEDKKDEEKIIDVKCK